LRLSGKKGLLIQPHSLENNIENGYKMRRLAIKSFLGLLNLAFMMGLSIFLPAGSFCYIQAWWYMAIFFGAVSIITVYIFINDKKLLQSRLKVGSIAEHRNVQKIIQGIASVGFIGMYVISGLDHRFQWSHLPDWVWIFSDLMLILTMTGFFIVFKKNTFLSATIEVQKHQYIVTDGPYSIVRHPMYSAALFLFLFTPLALNSYWALLTLPLMFTVLVFRCLDEEKVLKEEIPEYSVYCKNVTCRLIPFIW
jgi:protein-S-isoprenylcysteine O-methyltransferase Ste14